MRFSLLIFAAVIASCAAVTHSLQRQAAERGQLCSLKNPKVDESSGVAVSRRARGIYWTHNDSGDGPNFFAFDSNGADLGTYTLKGVDAFDWEDMASAKIDRSPYLYLGDIGDNISQRKRVRVYRVPEPEATPGNHAVTKFETYILTYPDGAHNCETLLVTPNGDIQLVTKSDFGLSAVYQAKRPSGSGTYAMKKIGDLKIESSNVYGHMLTSGDISSDGDAVVLRTYMGALLFRSKDMQAWFRATPTPITLTLERQGEAICFDLANHRFLTTSEGAPCRVSFVKIPD